MVGYRQIEYEMCTQSKYIRFINPTINHQQQTKKQSLTLRTQKKRNNPLNIYQPQPIIHNPFASLFFSSIPRMFSSFPQPQTNLFTSERFYYNNYQYYNDYQKIQSKYSDDLSKVYFRVNRKTKGTIFYEWNHSVKPVEETQSYGSSMMDIENEINRNSQNQHDLNAHKDESATKQLGIENLLATVLQTFHEQNYSDIRLDQQPRKQLYEFVHLKYLNQLNHIYNPLIQDESVTPYEPNSIDVLNQIIKKQSEDKELYYETMEKMNSFAKQEDQMFLERWNAFENFGFFHLDHQLLKKEHARSYKQELKRLYKFVIKVRFTIERTLAATYFNSLLVNLPNLKKTSRIFHPLTMGLNYTNKFFQQKNGYKKKPRIVFLNLDGRETPYNLRYARNVGQNLMYISVFKQPSHSYKKSQKMDYEFESEYDTTFANISENYSRLLINEAYPLQELFANDENKYRDKSKMLIFPLSSEYLRKEYYKTSREKSSSNSNNNTNTNGFPKLQTSHDIYFLFQTIIFQQIRSFDPSFIIVSYNGYLNLSQQHWNEIVKNLTIIADHKICLFVNFIDQLRRTRRSEDEEQQDYDQQEEQQELEGQEPQEQNEQQPQEQDDLDEFKVRNIQVIRQFINKYIPFKHFWPNLDYQRIINCILMFLKISSGVYSMQPRLLLAHHLKYSLGHRYAFLEALCQSKELSQYMQKYVPKLLRSEEIGELYGNQAKIELKENRKQNQTYQKLIDSVIMQFLNEKSRQSRTHLNHKLYYRLQQILQQQQYQNLLRYGTQQDQHHEYSSNFSHSNTLQNRQSFIVHDYLKEMKRKLLLENLETYKHKKVFYHEEDVDSSHQSLSMAQKIKFYKFYLYQDDAEEISFEKYTQIIFDPKRSRVYIINYKVNDQRHLILYGNMTPTTYEKKFSVKVQIAKQSQSNHHPSLYSLFTLKDMNENMQSSQQQSISSPRKDLVFVNYSHCFVKNKLYLYWPQKWSIRDQIRHKLLNLRYKPQNVNVMLRVQYNSDNHCVYETLQVKDHQKIYVHPRIRCSSYQLHSQTSDDDFFIFGGIQDNEDDFCNIGEGMYNAHIKDGSNSFVIKPLPKIKEKIVKQSPMNVMNLVGKKNFSFALRLRPKMHYRIERYVGESSSNSPEVKLIISGGYGREFTNFFNFFSFDSYLFDVNTKLIQAKEIHKRRLIKLPKPIQVNRVGKFYMISNNQNIQEVEENFSDLPKDFFAFEYKTQKGMTLGMNSQQGRENRQQLMSLQSGVTFTNVQNYIAKHCQSRQVHSFIDQRYRTSDFKFDGKKIYLCGFNRTIRQKIYSKFWSPQLYILDGNQSSIVHISLKTQKSFNYNISNFLMPRQEDIISLCLDEDKLYVLSSSPVIHSIDYSNSRYVLYEGNLSSMSDVINKHQLQMYQRFDFKKQKDNMLKYKTLYAFDQKIYLFGGLAVSQDPSIMTLTNEQSMDIESRGKVSYREDYILEKEKNKFVLKTRKVESSKDSVEMLSPAIVKFNELLYFYSIEMTQTVVKIPNTPFNQSKENYKLKIEEFNSQSSAEGRCISQIMKFYAWDGQKKKIQRIVPRLKEPKFVSIAKHQPFNLSKFREHLEKAAIRLRKYIYEKFTTDKKGQEKSIAEKKIQEDPTTQQKLQDFLSKCLLLLKERDRELVISTLQAQDKFFKDLINSIRPQVNERERNVEQEELIKDLKICYSLVNKLILQSLVSRAQMQESNHQQTSLNHESMSNENIKKEKLAEKFQKLNLSPKETTTEYRFIVDDSKSSRKIRYIAIGPLVNVKELRFFRIRFKHDVSLSLNKTNQDGFYYHPTVNSCDEIDLNDQFIQYDIMSEEDIKKDFNSYKEYKLYCQLKF